MATVGTIDAKVGLNLRPLQTAGTRAKAQFKDIANNMKRTFKVAAIASGVAIAGIGIKAIKLGSDFEETNAKFNTAFRGIEKQAKQTAETLAESYNISRIESQKLLSSTGDLLKGFGFTATEALGLSNSVQELSADLASYNNLEGGASRASEILTKALLGERDALTSLGIKISEEDVKQKLLQRGQQDLTGTTLLAAKAQATFELALAQSGDALGDTARNTDTFAYQIRRLQKNLTDTLQVLGEPLKDAATKAITTFNEGFKKVNLQPIKTALGDFLIGLGNTLISIAVFIDNNKKAFDKMKSNIDRVFGNIKTIITDIWDSIILIISNEKIQAALLKIGTAFTNLTATITKKLGEATTFIKEFVEEALKDFEFEGFVVNVALIAGSVTGLSIIASSITAALGSSAIIQQMTTAGAALGTAILNGLIAGISGAAIGTLIGREISTSISGATNYEWWQDYKEGLKNLVGIDSFFWKDIVFGNMKKAFEEQKKDFEIMMSNVVSDFKNFGNDIMMGLKEGIENAKDTVVSSITNMGDTIKTKFKNLLGIKSPSRVFKGYGKNIVEGLSEGISKNVGIAGQSIVELGEELKESGKDLEIKTKVSTTGADGSESSTIENVKTNLKEATNEVTQNLSTISSAFSSMGANIKGASGEALTGLSNVLNGIQTMYTGITALLATSNPLGWIAGLATAAAGFIGLVSKEDEGINDLGNEIEKLGDTTEKATSSIKDMESMLFNLSDAVNVDILRARTYAKFSQQGTVNGQINVVVSDTNGNIMNRSTQKINPQYGTVI